MLSIYFHQRTKKVLFYCPSLKCYIHGQGRQQLKTTLKYKTQKTIYALHKCLIRVLVLVHIYS